MKVIMPRGASLHHANNRLFEAYDKDQLVPDERYSFRPSEMVERKLQSVLPGTHIPISSLHHNRFIRR